MILSVPAFLAGMICVLISPTLPRAWMLGLLFVLVVFFFYISTKRLFLAFQISSKQQKTALVSANFFLGVIWFSMAAYYVLAQRLPPSFENVPLLVEGEIVSLPVTANGELQFQFLISKICENKACKRLHLNALLNWPNSPPNIRVAQVWQLPVKLKRPHTYANPGSFNREAFLLQNRIRATGRVSPIKQIYPKLIAEKWSLVSIRQYYDQKLLEALQNKPFAGVIDALTVGNSAQISQEQWRVFRNTGTSHLIAISGLHIGMIAALFYVVGMTFWRFSASLCEKCPAQKVGALFGIAAAFLYSGFSGFSIPAERTLIMIVAWMGSLLMSRYSRASQRFMFGLACVLIINPFSIMNSGFWLSFSAIALIGYGLSGRLSSTSLWWRYGRVQWIASIGLMPLSWLLFQQSSIIGLLANFIAIPWVGFITVPLALVGCIILPINARFGQDILFFSEKTLEWIWHYLHYLSVFTYNSWFLGFSTSWLILPLMVAVLLFLAPIHFPGRWLAFIWFFPVFFIRPAKLPENALKLTVLDVGQGLSVVIETRTHTAVYDTGIGYPDGYNMGDVVLLPFFRVKHISQLDDMIISHHDADHSGGAKAVLKKFKNVVILASAIDQFKAEKAIPCEAGQSWLWDGVNFAILYPFRGQAQVDNNSSCVLQIEASGNRVLLPGDIEKPAEAELLAKYQEQLSSYVLVAPHHGSSTSSSEPFLNMVNPKIAIFATGYLNRYHFPADKVVLRYQALGSRLYNSAYDGAVTITFLPNKSVSVHTYREDYPHFWD